MDLFVLLPPERWFAEALDYFACAAHLFAAMTDGSLPQKWPRAKAAGFLYAHGVELFLKAGIAQAEARLPKTHNLKTLKGRFDSLYLDTGVVLPDDIDAFIRENEKFPFATFLKYPEIIADLGKTWRADIYINVSEWAARTARVLEQVQTVWGVVMEKHPRNLAFWTTGLMQSSNKSPPERS